MHNSKDIEILTTTAEKIEFTDHDSNFFILFFVFSFLILYFDTHKETLHHNDC